MVNRRRARRRKLHFWLRRRRRRRRRRWRRRRRLRRPLENRRRRARRRRRTRVRRRRRPWRRRWQLRRRRRRQGRRRRLRRRLRSRRRRARLSEASSSRALCRDRTVPPHASVTAPIVDRHAARLSHAAHLRLAARTVPFIIMRNGRLAVFVKALAQNREKRRAAFVFFPKYWKLALSRLRKRDEEALH